jgi:tannase
MATIIDWVENGIKPSRLNATVSAGDDAGEVQQLCQCPQRPKWSVNSTDSECESDEASIDRCTYTFDAFKLPVY